MTYAVLITRALQDLQVTDGTTADPNDVALALDRLNDWIDALALEGLTIPSISRVTWTIGSGTTSYTVGSGSTVNVSKPVSPQAISNLGYADTSLTTPQEILFGRVLTEAEYQGIPQKTYQATYPTSFYYDPTTGTTGTLKPFPIPTSATLTGVIYTPSLLSEVALGDTVSLPRGYRRYFRSNLTVELAAAFDKPVPAVIAKIATDSAIRVKAANVRPTDLQLDAAVPGLAASGIYNILTDN